MRITKMGALAALVALGAIGCKKKDGDTKGPDVGKLTAADERALRDMTKGLEAIKDADPRRRALLLGELLAEVAGPDYAGFGKFAMAETSDRMLALAEGTDFVCKDGGAAMAADTGAKLAVLAEKCGAAYYGLPKGQEALLSPEWFLVQRAGAWLAKTRARAAGRDDLLRPLDAAMAGTHFILPVPGVALGHPAPRVTARRQAEARTYVVVTAGAITLAALPSAVLTADGATLEDVPGGRYPGKPVALDGLDAAASMVREKLDPDQEPAALHKVQVKPEEPPPPEEVEEEMPGDEHSDGTGTKQALEEGKMGKKDSTRPSGQYKMMNRNEDPQLARQRKLEQAKQAGVLGVMNKEPGGQFASITGTDDFSAVRQNPEAPLVVADRTLPAARVMDVITRLARHGAALAIGGGEMWGLAAHQVMFGQLDDTQRPPQGESGLSLHVEVNDREIIARISTGEQTKLARVGDTYDWPALAAWLQERQQALQTTVLGVRFEGTVATYQDLLSLLDVAASVGILLAVVDPA